MRKLLAILFLTTAYSTYAQQILVPLEHEYLNRIERYLNNPDADFHTAVKPYSESDVLKNIPYSDWKKMGISDYDEHFLPFKDSIGRVILQKGKEGFYLSANRGDLIQIQKDKFYLGVNPIVDFSAGYDLKAKSSYMGSQYGVQLNSNIGSKVSFGFAYRGLTEKSPEYIGELADTRAVLPGFGRVSWDGNKLKTHDFDGYVNYRPAQFIDLRVGYGKHFWGDGYRSLLLSDYAPSYPYFELNANFWKIKYTYLFNVMKDGSPYDFNQASFNTKYSVFHLVSLNATKWLEFSFFEGVIWERADSSGVRGIDVNYLNPVVFLRPIEFAVGSPDNITLGINMKFKVSKHTQIYSQFLLDDLDIKFARLGKGFYRNKFAFQLGMKSYDLFKVPLLDFQVEVNAVRPYVYAHKVPSQNFTHMNMPLAHPLGANFIEMLGILRYEKNHFYGTAKVQFAVQGRDQGSEHNGSNIYRSDFDINGGNLDLAFNNSFLQGVKTHIFNTEIRGGYRLNPRNNLSAELIFNYRKLSSDIQQQSNAFIGIGIKSNLFNRYSDF